jgi:hypothetical protein
MSVDRRFARAPDAGAPGLTNAFFRPLSRPYPALGPAGIVAELYVTDADGRTSIEPISAARADSMIMQLASLKVQAAARERAGAGS